MAARCLHRRAEASLARWLLDVFIDELLPGWMPEGGARLVAGYLYSRTEASLAG